MGFATTLQGSATLAAFASVLVLSSCGALDDRSGSGKPPQQVRNVSSELLFAVESFEAIHGKQISYPVVLGDPGQGLAGVCWSWTNGARSVIIDKASLSGMTTDMIEEIVWHELGHCTLGRGHNDLNVVFSWAPSSMFPASVMNSYQFNSSEGLAFKKEREYYKNELFNF